MPSSAATCKTFCARTSSLFCICHTYLALYKDIQCLALYKTIQCLTISLLFQSRFGLKQTSVARWFFKCVLVWAGLKGLLIGHLEIECINEANGPKGRDGPKWTQLGSMGPNGRKWGPGPMDPNGPGPNEYKWARVQ